jgi:hypothetical protein
MKLRDWMEGLGLLLIFGWMVFVVYMAVFIPPKPPAPASPDAIRWPLRYKDGDSRAYEVYPDRIEHTTTHKWTFPRE